MNGYLTTAFKRIKDRLITGRSDYETEDALQEAFCRLWSRRSLISGEKEAEGLLVTAAKNIRIDNYRRQSEYPSVGIDGITEPPDCSAVDSTDDMIEVVHRLASALLSERDREILFHRERDGWEFDEIADYYGLSSQNVRTIVSRSRKAIREMYRKSR